MSSVDHVLEDIASELWRREGDPLERNVYSFAEAPSRLNWLNNARAAMLVVAHHGFLREEAF